MITISTVWAWFLAACAAIITVSTAFSQITGVIKKFQQPGKDYKELEARVSALETKQSGTSADIRKILNDQKVTQEALLALLGHAKNGNNMDALTRAEQKLRDQIFGKGDDNE